MKTSFKKTAESTAADWQVIMGEQLKFIGGLPDRILAHMELLNGDYKALDS